MLSVFAPYRFAPLWAVVRFHVISFKNLSGPKMLSSTIFR